MDSTKKVSKMVNGVKKRDEDGPSNGFRVSQAFLEFAFSKEVEKFTVKLGTNPGDNYTSLMYAVEITFKGEEEAVQHYLIKCYPDHPGRRDLADQMNIFEKELFMYQDFIPILSQVMKDSGADEKIAGLSTAPFHGGNAVAIPNDKWKGSEWANENFVIMTDLRKSQFVMADRINGLDMEHALLVIKEMARWHALGWAYKEMNGLSKLTDEFPSFLDQIYTNDKLMDQFKSFFDQIYKNALNVTEESLGKDHPAHLAVKNVIETYGTNLLRMFMDPRGVTEETYESMLRIKPEEDKDYNREPWLTGTHGDCWVNNLLFRYDSAGHPIQVTFVDLQMFREACPTVDLAYFLASSVRAPIRIPGKDKLLQTYHDAFILSCNELKVQPYPGFSFGSLKRRYRRTELFGLLVGLQILTFVLKPAEDAVDMDAADKNGSEDAADLFSNVVEGSDKNIKFQEELIPTLLDLYENGVI